MPERQLSFGEIIVEVIRAYMKQYGMKSLAEVKGPLVASILDAKFPNGAADLMPRKPRASKIGNPAALRIYSFYPRKVGREAALRAIVNALGKDSEAVLTAAVQQYAQATRSWTRDERRFIPHPSTWFNEGRWTDDPNDWLLGHETVASVAKIPVLPLSEPEGWQEEFKCDPDLAVFVRRTWGSIPNYYQQQIVRKLNQTAHA